MSGTPGTSSGYDPIVGAPPNQDPESMVTISSLDPNGPGNPGPNSGKAGARPTKPCHVTITNLKQQSFNAGTSNWTDVTTGPEPFIVDAAVGTKTTVGAGQQYVLPCPTNPAYTQPLPARLVVDFTVSDANGANASAGSHVVTRES